MNEQELQIQRLVDGQLDREQIRELLVHAEQEPELWKEIAALFVEEQIWRGEVLAEFPPEQVRQDEAHPPVKTKGRQAAQGQGPGVKFLLAIAAAVILGVWLGRVWNPSQSMDPSLNHPVASHNETNTDESSLPESQSNGDLVPGARPLNQLVANQQPAHELSVQDVGNVPLYTLEQAQEMGLVLNQQSVPQETVDQLRRNGYQLEQNTQYISGKTRDGRKVVVPIRSVRFNPGN